MANAGSFQPRVQIHSAVQVEGETVKLSDLLPPDAPGGLGEICRQVILGDAPLAASQRVISRVQIEQQLREFPSTLQQLEIPDRVIVTRKRRRLSSTEILAAIETCMARGELDGFRTPNLNGLKLAGASLCDQTGSRTRGEERGLRSRAAEDSLLVMDLQRAADVAVLCDHWGIARRSLAHG